MDVLGRGAAATADTIYASKRTARDVGEALHASAEAGLPVMVAVVDGEPRETPRPTDARHRPRQAFDGPVPGVRRQ